MQPEEKTFEALMSDAKYARMGKIIYCHESQVDRFKSSTFAPAGGVHEDVNDLGLLRNIEPGHLYLVTKQHLMRGFDYRCSAGLAVLIARKLDSKRALR